MGGLAPRLVPTTLTFLVAAGSLSGIPPLAGFFSKEEILTSVYHAGYRWLWAILLIGTFMTAVYTFRLVFLTFFGGPRMSREMAHRVHESPPVMTVPLGLLAVLTVVAGLAVGIPFAHGTLFARFLAPVFPVHEAASRPGLSAYALLLLSVIAAVAGLLLAWRLYGARPVRAEAIGRPRNSAHRLLIESYYVDLIYDACVVRPIQRFSEFLARVFDLGFIDGIVNGVGKAVAGWAQGMRRLQTGYVASYALTMLLGVVAMLGFFLARGGFLTR